MKWLLSFLFLLFSFNSFSQYKTVSFSTIDARVEDIDAPTADSLSHLLTQSYTTELEKVRSIFYWITDHISYNTIRYQPRHVNYVDDGEESIYDGDSILRPLDERVADIVLKRRYALCDGYARLFKALCNYAGIKSEVITGYARTSFNSGQFHCNHKWNAVMIDSNWYLLDATWASGYISFSGNNFIKDYNDNYFLTPPKYFIQDHYPDDIKWTLLNDPPTLGEFNRSPFKQPSFNYKIISYSPSKGIINATVGDTITITLQTSDDKKNLFLLDLNSVDSAGIAFADSCLKANKSCFVRDDKVSARYVVTNEDAQWLQVIYNGDVVLRYKLNIKKQPFPFPPIIIKDIALNN
ncbi:MAG TPA: transglutaminase domain-containing protein [Parafilimonas sp.]